jgi:hypothetical protein
VNLLWPLRVEGDPPVEMFALATWVLPRVPVAGEEIRAIGSRATIERVLWDDRGRAIVRLRGATISADELGRLELEGWDVGPWEDEPPEAWLRA